MGRYALVGLAIVLASSLFWWVIQPEQVSDPEMVSGESPGAPMVEVVVPETFSANAKIGQRAFDTKCADCHGANAAGQEGVAPPLVHKIYEPSHHGDQSFLLAAKNGVRAHHWKFGNMPAVDGLTDGDVKMIIAYVRELQRANGIN